MHKNFTFQKLKIWNSKKLEPPSWGVCATSQKKIQISKIIIEFYQIFENHFWKK